MGAVWPIRVYYEDTDTTGAVYHATYLAYAERARTELLRAGGNDHQMLLAEHGIAFVVRRCEIDYLKPARLDDLLEVHTIVTAVRGASINMKQRVGRGGDTLAQLNLELACVNRSGRPARLPQAVRSAFAAHSAPPAP